jgi:hypothetical protein
MTDLTMKAIRIEEDGRCHVVRFKPGDKLEGQHMDHLALMALEHKGLKLGMFGLEWTQKDPPDDFIINRWDEEAKDKYNTYNENIVAMKLIQYLKFHGRLTDYLPLVKGPVLLYDDTVDMSIRKWNIIWDYIRKIKNKKT